LSAEQIVITPDAVDPAFALRRSSEHLEEIRGRYELPDRFILAVGNLQPRKNLGRLLAAAETIDTPVVIAGRPHWGDGRTDRQGSGRWLGYVPFVDLVGLYDLCSVFAYPSLYEGFGLPALEAMAAGAPVVASSAGAIPEVVGDAAVLVDPTDEAAIAEGLRSVLDDQARADDLRLRGREQITRFSWDESARALLERARTLHAGSTARGR
jgi:glycosyltransferase involved in cell wall biosynthesis